MLNQHYSIFVAQDNLSEVICGLSSLYFGVVPHKMNICDHYFSLLSNKGERKNNHLANDIIYLNQRTLERIIQKALLLKSKQLSESEDIVVSLGGAASFTVIFSVFYE